MPDKLSRRDQLPRILSQREGAAKNLIHRRAMAEKLDPVQFGEAVRLQKAGFEQQLAIDEEVTTLV